MDSLLRAAFAGVDPGAPGAFWMILRNLLALLPWWPLLWFTLACTVVGAALGWWRGRAILGAALGLLLGPFGWPLVWLLPRGGQRHADGDDDPAPATRHRPG